ncbi:replication initiation protein [Salmonella enterica subsp. enterica serovar Infantis]|uniref:replication initiation protein n=1 Tax=Citrobacter freundii TaxID=546 RepID=UPI001ECB4651|nr:replication initiation protein [Salmonella enterica subsp. enterica serovar Infantis]
MNAATTCRHSDDFQFSMAKLSLQAKRVLVLMLAQISNPTEIPKDENLTFTVKASEFAVLCDVDIKSSYALLDKAVNDLSVSFIYKDLSLGELRRLRKTPILDDVLYCYDEGYCELSLNKKNYHYFFDLVKSFTSNNVHEVLRLDEKNLFNFHQVLNKRFSKRKVNPDYRTGFVIGVDELKDEMWLFDVVGNKKEYNYKEFKYFNKFLKKIASSMEAATSFKNISIDIAEKCGRKATHLKISYQHADDIHKQEQRLLDEEEKRLGII